MFNFGKKSTKPVSSLGHQYEKEIPLAGQDLIDQWDSLLSNSPLIGDNDEAAVKLPQYVHYIHEQLSRVDKGTDLGIAMYIAACIQDEAFDMNSVHHANRISFEVNSRMVAHMIYIQQLLQLQYTDPEVAKNPVPTLVDMAQLAMSQLDWHNEPLFSDLGIKGIEFMSMNILD